MYKLLASCAVIALTAIVTLPTAAAAEQRPDGMRTSNLIEVSSVRRYRHYGYAPRHHYARRGYAGSYYAQPYYDRPSYGYGYAQEPGWGPAPFPFVLGLPY